MNKKRAFWGLLLIVAGGLVMAGLAGCDNGTTPNNGPKSLKITGITVSGNFMVGVFPLGTSKETARTEGNPTMVAGFQGPIAETIGLKAPGNTPWTGTETYDVFMVKLNDATRTYVKRNISIENALTEIPHSSFSEE